MSDELERRFGRRVIAAGPARVLLGRLFALTLAAAEGALEEEGVAEAEREVILGRFAEEFAGLLDAARIGPVQPGELLLVGEGAEEALRESVRAALEQLRREWGEGEP